MNQTKLPVLLFLFAALGDARLDRQTCGTNPMRVQEELFLHRRSMASPAKIAALAARANRPATRDAGNIVIMDDTGVVSRRNAFNLDRRFLLFRPAAPNAAQYQFESGQGGYDQNLASTGTPLSGLDDDDTREMSLPFDFPFYGRSYRQVFVNSDGNLTFGSGDNTSADRSIGRMTSGPPRISPMFADLDPSRRADSVRFDSAAGRVTFSWISVPEYQSFGIGPSNTFQVSLFPDGRIQFAWEGINSRDAVVGIAPGSLRGTTALLSFSTPDTRTFSGAVIEGFSNIEAIDIVLAAQKFYENHDDTYDYLVIYNNLGVPASAGAVAFEVTVRNDRTGIGDIPTDLGREFGSARRLQAVLNLGPLNQYPADPNAIVPSRSISRDTPLTVLGHEAGHLWLAFASVRDPNDPAGLPMLGRQTAHWAFTFNSEASLLEGNRIRDNGPDASPRFTTTATVEGYSPLDQYLMGFRDPRDVAPSFYVANSSIGNASRQPQTGVSFNGDRRDVSIDDLIAAEGSRRPDHTVAQRRFRLAFILLAREGTEPSPTDMAQIEGYRAAFEGFFARTTDDRATASTSIVRELRLSVFPAAGTVVGGVMPASLEIGTPAESPITVLLRTGGLVTAPASVTIPAGQRRVAFELRGARPGVDDVEASPADTRYAVAHARVQVAEQPSSLKLAIVSGDRRQAGRNTVVVRASDENNLPYLGIEITAAPSEGGSVASSRVTTGENGQARFDWTSGSGPVLELRLALAAAPTVTVTATAVGTPLIAANGIVNAASFVPGIAPGAIASIFGSSMAGGALRTASFPLRDELGGVRVLVNGLRATPIYVSDRQINFIVPDSLAPGDAEISIVTVAPAIPGTSNTVRTPIRAVDPGIFGILLAGTTVFPQFTAVPAGSVIEIYSTGLGAIRGGSTAIPVEATIGGSPAEVLFSGPAPGFPGLYQVNARIPQSLPSGSRPVVLRQGPAVSNSLPILIQ
jgi:uncharacterized protein (TIGR03437 family)